MPIFAPFSYLSTPIPPPWSPADFTNIQYWWTADAGVTESSGVVSSWVDQINSFDLKQTVSGNRPTLSTSANLNGQSVISFDGTDDFLTTEAMPASRTDDFMILIVYAFTSATPGNGIVAGTSQLDGTPNGRIWLDGLNGNQRFFTTGFASPSGNVTVSAESPITTGPHSFFARYDSSAGDTFYALNTLSESTLGTTGNTNQNWVSSATVAAGASVISNTNNSIFLNRYIDVDIAEFIYVYDSPSTDEMNKWKSYVNTKYGTIIS